MWRGALSNISSWAAGVMTETWREPINFDRIHQTSKSVVFLASSDEHLWPHVRDVTSDKYKYAVYFLRSDTRIRSGCQKQEVGSVIVKRGIVNYETPRRNPFDTR